MTRNNLGTHLSWLLQNLALSKPTIVSFPTPQDPPSARSSQSQLELPGSSSQSGVLSRSVLAPTVVSRAPSSTSPNALQPVDDNQFEDEEEVLAAEAAMARLTSASKFQKASLQQQQPTPSSMAKPSNLRQAYAATLERHSSSTQKYSSPLPGTRRKEHHSSRTQTAVAETLEDSLDFVDLTGDDTLVSSDSIQFGNSVTVWTEDHASRAEPLSRTSKKRKSDEISQVWSADDEDDDDFPDIDEAIKAVSTPGQACTRSAKTSRDHTPSLPRGTNDTAIFEEHTVMQTFSRTERRVRRTTDAEPFDTPTRQLHEASSQQLAGKTPRKAHESPSTGSGKRLCMSRDWLPSSGVIGSTNKARTNGRRLSCVVQDSDDEFAMPLTHNTSKISPSGGRSDIGQDGASKSLPPNGETPSRSRTKRPQKHGENPSASQRKGSGDGASSSETGNELDARLRSLLSDDQAALQAAVQAKKDIAEQDLKQNGADYARSLRESWPKEEREKVKSAKEPLLKRRQALDSVLNNLRSYHTLRTNKETLTKKTAQAYLDGHDVEEEEIQVEEIDGQLKSLEQTVLLSLADVGFVDASFFDEHWASEHQLRQAAASTVVLSTQLPQYDTASLSRTTTLQDSFTEVIPLTQVPTAKHSAAQHKGGFAAKKTSIVTEDESTPPFPRCPGPGLRDLKGTSWQTPRMDQGPSPNYGPSPDYNPPDFDSSDDLMDLDTIAPVQRDQGSPLGNRRSPQKGRNHFGDGVSSDVDEEEMLAVVKDCEQSFSEHASKHRRPALSERSGNTATKAANVLKKREPSKAKPAIRPELMVYPWSADVKKALKDRFRMTGFRTNQLEAINATLAGKDAFILMPTGGGKSLCYQLPAVISSGKTRGVTIVISPLISLMQDQVEHLKALNILARGFNGEQKAEEKNQVMAALKERNPEHFVQLLYVTPEMVNKSAAFTEGMLNLYRNGKLARIVIDEAHCVSQWGHDFRPDYKELGRVRRQYPGVPVMALTATATQNVIVDIKNSLGMKNCQDFSQSFNRDNLYYEIRRKQPALTNTIASTINRNYPNQTGIVYTLSRKTAEQVAEKLESQGIRASYYHAGMTPSAKTSVQQRWQEGRIKVVVATIAFGMGIDKPDVRFVIHYAIPKSLEGYYQETGRAGRDGKPSDCILFFGRGDVATLRRMVMEGEGSWDQKERQLDMLQRVAAFCENQTECRRSYILRYFGERFNKASCNKTCDNCKNALVFEQRDVTEIAVAAIELVCRRRLTMNQCADVLMGKKIKRDDTSTGLGQFGIAKRFQKHEVTHIIDKLNAEGALGERNGFVRGVPFPIQYLELGPNADDFLSGQRSLTVSIQVGDRGVRSAAPKKKGTRKKKDAEPPEEDEEELLRLPQSTNFTSPPPMVRRGERRASAAADYDGEDQTAVDANGYAKDGFIVSDDEDDDEHFEPLPKHRKAKPRSTKVGPPISQDQRLEDLPDIHQDIVHAFVQEAKEKEESLRNDSGLRKPLFSERDFREMATNWTTTLTKMRGIKDIDKDKVKQFGNKFVPLVKRYQAQYEEIMDGQAKDEDGATDAEENDVVDLVSEDEFEDFGEEDEAELSKYFESRASNPPKPNRTAVQEWRDAFPGVSQPQSSRSTTSTRGKTATRGSRKAPFGRRGGSGSFYKGKGVSKRKGPAGDRKPSGTTKSATNFLAKGSKSSRGGGGGGGGIGLMPM